MKTQVLLAASAMVVLSAAASAAEEVRVERKQVCTCTVTDGKGTVVEEKTMGPGGPSWQQKDGPHVVIAPEREGDDVDVQVFNDGKTEKRVVIVRRGPDGADENKDGKVSRKEFMTRAEKHFAEMDRDKNGALEKDEMRPPVPPMPALPPGVAPLPPVPPVPPAPPAN
ncbi:MAG: hypothetical protein ACKVRO_18285 [Micropepsaceae bacterium]